MRQPPGKIVPALTLVSFLALGLAGCGRESRGISGKIPEVTFRTHLGEQFTLTGEGKDATLLVFWATWCGPCLMEIPSLIELQQKFKGKNFRVVSIILDDPEGEKSKRMVSNYGINYPILLGSEETAKQYGGVVALPTSLLIGRDGKIKEKVMGLLPEAEMERKVLKLLGGTG